MEEKKLKIKLSTIFTYIIIFILICIICYLVFLLNTKKNVGIISSETLKNTSVYQPNASVSSNEIIIRNYYDVIKDSDSNIEKAKKIINELEKSVSDKDWYYLAKMVGNDADYFIKYGITNYKVDTINYQEVGNEMAFNASYDWDKSKLASPKDISAGYILYIKFEDGGKITIEPNCTGVSLETAKNNNSNKNEETETETYTIKKIKNITDIISDSDTKIQKAQKVAKEIMNAVNNKDWYYLAKVVGTNADAFIKYGINNYNIDLNEYQEKNGEIIFYEKYDWDKTKLNSPKDISLGSMLIIEFRDGGGRIVATPNCTGI